MSALARLAALSGDLNARTELLLSAALHNELVARDRAQIMAELRAPLGLCRKSAEPINGRMG